MEASRGNGMHPAGAFKGKAEGGVGVQIGTLRTGAALQQSLPVCSEQPLAVGLLTHACSLPLLSTFFASLGLPA